MSVSSFSVQRKHTQCYQDTSGEERVEHVLRTADSPLLTTEQVSQHQLWSRLTHQRCSYSYCAGDNIQVSWYFWLTKYRVFKHNNRSLLALFSWHFTTLIRMKAMRGFIALTQLIFIYDIETVIYELNFLVKLLFTDTGGSDKSCFTPQCSRWKLVNYEVSGHCSLLLFSSSAPSQWSLNLIARESFMVSTRTIFTARIKWSNDMITIH